MCAWFVWLVCVSLVTCASGDGPGRGAGSGGQAPVLAGVGGGGVNLDPHGQPICVPVAVEGQSCGLHPCYVLMAAGRGGAVTDVGRCAAFPVHGIANVYRPREGPKGWLHSACMRGVHAWCAGGTCTC